MGLYSFLAEEWVNAVNSAVLGSTETESVSLAAYEYIMSAPGSAYSGALWAWSGR